MWSNETKLERRRKLGGDENRHTRPWMRINHRSGNPSRTDPLIVSAASTGFMSVPGMPSMCTTTKRQNRITALMGTLPQRCSLKAYGTLLELDTTH